MVAEPAHLDCATGGLPASATAAASSPDPAAPAPVSSSEISNFKSPVQPSPPVPSRQTDILTAFAQNIPLPQIIATFNLSPEDLHTFLTTSGIPDRLQALRALARFDQDLRTIQAQNEATEFLRGFLKNESHKPEERRRAATALLKGPGPSPSARAAGTVNPDRQAEGSRWRGGARPPTRPDIADWSPSDSTLDAEDDADLDDDEDLPAPPIQNPQSKIQNPPPRLPLTATPDEIVANQLACIQFIDKPTLTPHDIYAAIDYHQLSFYNRYYAASAIAFEQALINSPLLNIAGAELTADPAIIRAFPSLLRPLPPRPRTHPLPRGRPLRLAHQIHHPR